MFTIAVLTAQDGKGSQGPSTPAKAPVPPGIANARGVASPGMNAAALPFSSPSTSRAGGGNDAAFAGCADCDAVLRSV